MAVANKMGYELTRNFMDLATLGGVGVLQYGEGSAVVRKIKASNEMKNIINNFIYEHNTKGITHATKDDGEFKSGDLLCAIQHFKWSITMTGSSRFRVTVMDTYDFTEIRYAAAGDSVRDAIAKFANNYGALAQSYGVLTPFDIVASFYVDFTPNSNSGSSSNVNVTYQTYTSGRWLPNVVNLNDYAGIYGQNIEGIQVHVI